MIVEVRIILATWSALEDRLHSYLTSANTLLSLYTTLCVDPRRCY